MCETEDLASAAKLLADIVIVARANNGQNVDLRRLSKTVIAAMMAAGQPYAPAWLELYVTAATTLSNVRNADPQCTAMRRLSQFVAENGDLEPLRSPCHV